jgi:hypothetical protein
MRKTFKKVNEILKGDQSCSTPEVIDYGMLIQVSKDYYKISKDKQKAEEPVLTSYMIMPRFG